MRSLSLTHVLLSALLWCAAVMAFVGMNFTAFETASRDLQDSRLEMALMDLQRVFQGEMDKGSQLPHLKRVEASFSHYMAGDDDVLSVLVFDARSGRILFSTVGTQIGINVPYEWREKCRTLGSVFIEKTPKKETTGIPLFNTFNENEGCLVAEHKTMATQITHDQMRKTAFSATIRLSLFGIFACAVIYIFIHFKEASFMPKRSLYKAMVLLLCLLFIGIAVPRTVSSMLLSFEEDLKPNVAAKAQVITRIVQHQIEKAVNSGIPYSSMNGVEAYLERIRNKNPEVLFILLTDKTGRVLYEAGSAARAFDSDPRTGKISLRPGYYNVAEPVNLQDVSVGWVQIGVNERFVREKVF